MMFYAVAHLRCPLAASLSMIEPVRFDGPDYRASESFQKFAVITVQQE
jgi:hypothetical protein